MSWPGGERYPQLLRTPTRRWWKPLLGLLLATVVLVVGGVGVVLAAVLVAALTGAQDPFAEEALSADTPLGLLTVNLTILMIVPAALLAVLVVHRESPGWLASVAGRVRWQPLLRFLAVAFVVVVVFFAATFLLPPVGIGDVEVPGATTLVGLLAVVVLTTPLQAAAEEIGFRGYLTQAVGSWVARPVPGAVVAAGVTATLFAMAHGAQDPLLFGDRLAFGLVASWLVWRTGGLEAAVALHAANNLVGLSWSAVTGSLQESLDVSSLSWPEAALDVSMMVVFAVIADRLARRWGMAVRRVQHPAYGPPGPGVLSGPPAVGYPVWRPEDVMRDDD